MAWEETESTHFSARHGSEDADDVTGVLELLETTHERLAGAFPEVPQRTSVVVHPSDAALALAQPVVPLMRLATAPAARRYLVGWPSRATIHVLAPRLLAARASNVPGSREMELLAPSALYAQLVVGHNAPLLPPPFRAGTFVRAVRWAWLVFGAGQFFGGQTAHARPAIGRRLREGGEPSFPPGLRDAPLLGGTVLDLLAREEGERAAIRFITHLPPGGPRDALVRAFHGRPLVHTEGTWRAHLARLAGQASEEG
ncbi:hypothetical protein [Conexibacter sp. SYSU D00693]|uniref:hypothetical protein n=1 Tax=Conexibacter sp. SYSU D00693 TaxID=2812560 RepID=UPI00196AE483|nr:hypothetical protein [Conexibacter sp. SYSU D00693]